MKANPLLSVAQYIQLLNEQLNFYEAHIIGEVTQVKTSAKGHIYFTLKDKEKEAVLECVMWKGQYALYGIALEAGMEITATGKSNIYPAWGKLSFIVNTLAFAGEGALKKAYDALKEKLAKEGLFSPERKRTLPLFPRNIGVITSKHGAVIHDFMSNLGKHGFHITFIDSRVEGAEALPDLYQAVKTMKTKELDVIVLMRGGGSLQSFAAFDTETLVREVISSPIPIIAAIGHHQDVPLCTLASDVAVSTPTAAANLLNTSWEKASEAVTSDYQRVLYAYRHGLHEAQQTIALELTEIVGRFNRILDSFAYITSQIPKYLIQISRSLERIKREIPENIQRISKNIANVITENYREIQSIGTDKIVHSLAFSLKNSRENIDIKERFINAYNPMRQLSLGYSLVQKGKQKLVKSIKDVTIGEAISILTQDGVIGSVVKSIEEKKHDKTN